MSPAIETPSPASAAGSAIRHQATGRKTCHQTSLASAAVKAATPTAGAANPTKCQNASDGSTGGGHGEEGSIL